MFGTIICPHCTRSVSGPYLVRIWSMRIDTEEIRAGYGSGLEREEIQNILIAHFYGNRTPIILVPRTYRCIDYDTFLPVSILPMPIPAYLVYQDTSVFPSRQMHGSYKRFPSCPSKFHPGSCRNIPVYRAHWYKHPERCR